MTAQPNWSPVDDETNDLLTLVADTEHPSVDHEWGLFVAALRECACLDGVIDPNQLRPRIRGYIAPKRIGAFTSKALAEGLIAYTGQWVVSNDTEGRNSGKPAREMRWTGT